MPRHITDDLEPALRVLKVAVLDARLDHVEWGADNERGRRARDGRDEVLGPGCCVVVFQSVDVLFCCCGAAEELWSS